MKPDWNDAPEWANYLAMDENGVWFWYEQKPVLGLYSWLLVYQSRYIAADISNWRETLEERPKDD